MFRTLSRGTYGVAFACLMTVTSAEAVTIVNGSFEESGSGGAFDSYAAGNTAITGWAIGGGGVDAIHTYWQAADGEDSIDLNGGAQGSLSQTLTGLSVGRDYIVTFAMAGNPDGGGGTRSMQVSAGSASQSFSFDTTGFDTSNMGWVYADLVFRALGTTTTLTFLGLNTGPMGIALDDVSIAITAVPVPQSAVLLLTAVAGLAGAARRRG